MVGAMIKMGGHPCSGMSRKAVETFEAIAVSMPFMAAPQTIDALLKRGLIEQVGTREVMRDRFGVVTAPEYGVPLSVHYAWCKWCSENVEIPE